MNKLSAKHLAKQLSELLEMKAKAVLAAETVSSKEYRDTLIRLSSGSLSAVVLARINHPYARRRPQTQYPAFIINRQSGALNASWKWERPTLRRLAANRYQIVWRTYNTAPEAAFMEGTKRMIARPIRETAVRLTERDRLRRHKEILP